MNRILERKIRRALREALAEEVSYSPSEVSELAYKILKTTPELRVEFDDFVDSLYNKTGGDISRVPNGAKMALGMMSMKLFDEIALRDGFDVYAQPNKRDYEEETIDMLLDLAERMFETF